MQVQQPNGSFPAGQALWPGQTKMAGQSAAPASQANLTVPVPGMYRDEIDMPFGSAPPILPPQPEIQHPAPPSLQPANGGPSVVSNGSIGVFWRVDGGNRMILDHFSISSSAQKAGLQPGDQLAAVDGISVERRKLEDVAAQIVGPPGTRVQLGMYRNTAPFTVLVQRRVEPKTLAGIGVFWAPDAPVKLLGIGAFWTENEDKRIIVEDFARFSPAEKAGLMVGDELLAVDGVSVLDKPWEDVFHRIVGPAGTTVTFDVLRLRSLRLSVPVRRDHVNFQQDDGQHRIVINHFAHFSPAERAGLLVGDEVVAVEGVQVKFLDLHTVELDLVRDGSPLRVSVVRDSLETRLSQLDEFDAAMQAGGIGVTWLVDGPSRRLIAASLLPYSPARVAGMEQFDHLIAVNGRVVTGLPPSQVTQMLSGRVGSVVQVEVLRDQRQALTLDITRISI